jgi:hypothetical protein
VGPSKVDSAHFPGLRWDLRLYETAASANGEGETAPSPRGGRGIHCCHFCQAQMASGCHLSITAKAAEARPANTLPTQRPAPCSRTPGLTFPGWSALLAHSPQPGVGAAGRSVPGGRGRAGGVGAAHRRLPAQPPEPPPPPPPPPSMTAAPPPDNGSDAPPPAPSGIHPCPPHRLGSYGLRIGTPS